MMRAGWLDLELRLWQEGGTSLAARRAGCRGQRVPLRTTCSYSGGCWWAPVHPARPCRSPLRRDSDLVTVQAQTSNFSTTASLAWL